MSIPAAGSVPVRLKTPVPGMVRAFFIAVGLFVIGISTWELHRGVWPLNGFSPFFLFILIGAWSVGIPAILAGVTGWASSWTVTKGNIDIVERNPFRVRRHRIARDEIAALAVREKQAMEGDNTWVVSLQTTSGASFDTRDFGSRQYAERLRDEMLTALDD